MMLILLLPLFSLLASSYAIDCSNAQAGERRNDTNYVYECVDGNQLMFVGCITKMNTLVEVNTVGVYQSFEKYEHIINCTAPQPTITTVNKELGCLSSNFTFIALNTTIIENGVMMTCKKEKNGQVKLAGFNTFSCMRSGYVISENREATVENKFFFRCEADMTNPSKLVFLHCLSPFRVPIPLGETREENGKNYTCKSDSELIVEEVANVAP